jgi:phosphoglycerol transferase MdoB-like AlkP superfamily enzyme
MSIFVTYVASVIIEIVVTAATLRTDETSNENNLVIWALAIIVFALCWIPVTILASVTYYQARRKFPGKMWFVAPLVMVGNLCVVYLALFCLSIITRHELNWLYDKSIVIPAAAVFAFYGFLGVLSRFEERHFAWLSQSKAPALGGDHVVEDFRPMRPEALAKRDNGEV